MSNPTPESLALVEEIRAMTQRRDINSRGREWWRTVPELVPEDAARRIDAYVAERTVAFAHAEADTANAYKQCRAELDALRAAADAMAASLGLLLAQSILQSYGDPVVIEPARRHLAAHRALSPTDERP